MLAVCKSHNTYLYDTTTWTGEELQGPWRTSLSAFSPDMTLAVAASNDVKLWDLRKRSLRIQFPGLAPDTYAAVFAPAGQFVATLQQGSLVKVWDVTAARSACLWSAVAIDSPADHVALAFSHDGRFLATARSFDGTGEAAVWEVPARDGLAPDEKAAPPPNATKRPPAK